MRWLRGLGILRWLRKGVNESRGQARNERRLHSGAGDTVHADDATYAIAASAIAAISSQILSSAEKLREIFALGEGSAGSAM